MSEIVAAKSALRTEILAARKLKNTSGFTANIQKLISELNPQRVAVYSSFGTEPDTQEFIQESELPVITPVTHENHLSWVFHDTKKETTLTPGDLLLIPALAIDNSGNRLGRGKGYFDRELKRLPSGIKVYAIVYESEVLEEVPTEDHDHPVDGLITEVAIRNLN